MRGLSLIFGERGGLVAGLNAPSTHPHHKIAFAVLSAALEACIEGASLKPMPMVAASFLRLVTNPRIFVQPTPVAEAIAFLDAVVAVAGVELATISTERPTVRQLCPEKQLTANAIPDAWLAAAVIQLGEHLVTFDADFKKPSVAIAGPDCVKTGTSLARCDLCSGHDDRGGTE